MNTAPITDDEISTLAANLKHAGRSRQYATLGDGLFGPAELFEAGHRLAVFADLRDTLRQLVHELESLPSGELLFIHAGSARLHDARAALNATRLEVA